MSSVAGGYAEGRCLIVAEVAQTHDGSLGCAHAFIDAVANSGADAIKFQTHIAAEESTALEPWRVKFSKQDESRYEYWQRMEFTAEQWKGLKEHADERGLLFMSSPFSEAAVDLLSDIGMKVWKIASGEITNFRLLRKIAETGDPVIFSSGMSSWQELDEAIAIVNEYGNDLAVLQCTTSYPCPPEKVGLNILHAIRDRYGVPFGLSDHSGNIFAGLAAVTLGAEMLEVHVTLSREMFGPDVRASVTTSELKHLVNGCRDIEKMIDSPVEKDEMAEATADLRGMFGKSIVAGSDLAIGTVIEDEHLKLKKPGLGAPAAMLPEMVGKTLLRDIKTDELVMLADLEP